MIKGIEFSTDPSNFSVTYNSPSRKVKSLRDEFNVDAVTLSNQIGPAYISFSTGVDSQVIARSFLDMKLDVEFVFLHVVGCNDLEFNRLSECEKFFGIKVRVITLDVEAHKEQWLTDNNNNEIDSIAHYPFAYMCSQLDNDIPIITQGSVEPAIVGLNKNKVAIYHDYYESMELRFKLMNKHRKVYDFPASPESIASYYTDENMQLFVSTISYYNNGLKQDNEAIPYSQYYNLYAKSFVKGRHYKDDIIWYPKLTGAENFPLWLKKIGHKTTARVSVPYWDLVEFLTTETNTSKKYDDWIFK